MPRSMTAYARITEENSWGSITCELRSVNHRFLEVGFRMPDVLRESETALRDMTRKNSLEAKSTAQCKLPLIIQMPALP
jgi:uncharacterized protein (TIGR00255 family)